MVGVTHKEKLTSYSDDPTKGVSKDAWIAEHDAGACADVLTDHDKTLHDGLGIDAATLEGDDKATVQDHTPKTHANEAHSKTFIEGSEVPANETDPNVDVTLQGVTLTQVRTHAPAEHGNEAHNPDFVSGTGTIKTTKAFAAVSTLTIGTFKAPSLIAPCTLTIIKVKAYVRTAPTGLAIKCDINKKPNGSETSTTIFTNQDNRPTIAVSTFQADSGTPDVTSLAEGDRLDLDIDQVGSTIAGADLTVEVVCTQAVVFS